MVNGTYVFTDGVVGVWGIPHTHTHMHAYDIIGIPHELPQWGPKCNSILSGHR